MRKVFIVIFIIVCLCFSSCNPTNSYQISGLENYNPANSEYGTSDGIIPEDFIHRFDYVSGNYHYIEEDDFSLFEPVLDRSIIYLSYDSSIYSDAKKYVMDHMILSAYIVEECNGYVFYDNYADGDFSFPKEFKRFAYNDTNNTLLFIGFFRGDNFELTDWAAFLENYYSEWYDFSQ